MIVEYQSLYLLQEKTPTKEVEADMNGEKDEDQTEDSITPQSQTNDSITPKEEDEHPLNEETVETEITKDIVDTTQTNQTADPSTSKEEEAHPPDEDKEETEITEEIVHKTEAAPVQAEAVPVVGFKEIDVRPQEDFVAIQEPKLEQEPFIEKKIEKVDETDEMSASTMKDARSDKADEMSASAMKDAGSDKADEMLASTMKDVGSDKADEMSTSTMKDAGSDKGDEMSASTMKDAGSDKGGEMSASTMKDAGLDKGDEMSASTMKDAGSNKGDEMSASTMKDTGSNKRDEMSASTMKDAGSEKEEDDTKIMEQKMKEKDNEKMEEKDNENKVEENKQDDNKMKEDKDDANIVEDKLNEMQEKEEEMSSSTMKDAGSEKSMSPDMAHSDVAVHTIEIHGEVCDEQRKLENVCMQEEDIATGEKCDEQTKLENVGLHKVGVATVNKVENEETKQENVCMQEVDVTTVEKFNKISDAGEGNSNQDTKDESMRMVQIEVADKSQHMSDSTMKDAGGEKGLGDIKEEDMGNMSSEEHTKQKVEKETEVDELEKKKEQKNSKGKSPENKDPRSKVGSKKTNTVEKDKTPVKGGMLKMKTVGKKIETPDKRPSTKVASKVGSLINRQNMAKSKELELNNSKLSKNATNKKKADMGISAKNTTITVGVVTKQRRASAPLPKLDVNASSRGVGARSVIADIDEESVPKKTVKRERPKSKWDNIVSKIETNKKEVKPKPEVKSKIVNDRRMSLQPKTTSTTSTTKESVPKSTAVSRRVSMPNTSKLLPKPSPSARSPRPPKAKSGVSPEPNRPDSRASSSSSRSRPTTGRSTQPLQMSL